MAFQEITRKEDFRARLEKLSGWETTTRDDTFVAEELHTLQAIDRIYPLNEAAFFDEFFHYLDEIGVLPLLEDLDPKNRTRPLYPFIQFVMRTIMRCVGGASRACSQPMTCC